MAPFSRAAGRWCPLLRLQAEFPKEAFSRASAAAAPSPVLLCSRGIRWVSQRAFLGYP